MRHSKFDNPMTTAPRNGKRVESEPHRISEGNTEEAALYWKNRNQLKPEKAAPSMVKISLGKSLKSSVAIFVSPSTQSVIVLPHVTMARLSNHRTPDLQIYFSQSPHISLADEDEINEFLKALQAYHDAQNW